MKAIEILEERSKKKKANAIAMLYLAVAIIITGIFIFFSQLSSLSDSLSQSINMLTDSKNLSSSEKEALIRGINMTEIINMVSRIIFLIIIFFIAQIFLKLYKHNMNLSDFYFSCCDAWKLNEEEIDSKKKEDYISLLKALYPNEVKLEIPNSPDLASIASILKKD